MNGIRRQSMKAIPAARHQYTAGPASGKGRRANSVSTNSATAGTMNQSDDWGAPGALRLATTSRSPTIARSAMPALNQCLRAR